MSEQPYGTQRHQQFQAAVVRSVHGVDALARGQYEPCRAQHHAPPGQPLAGAVPHHVHSIVRQFGRPIQEMRGKLAMLHPVKDVLYVLRVIEIYFHVMSGNGHACHKT